MNLKIRLVALLAIAGMSTLLGTGPDAGFDHVWLALALAAAFAASDASYWKPAGTAGRR